MKRHPAFDLFEELFNKAAIDPGPVRPSYFVLRTIFHDECRKRGIAIPENWVDAVRWEESIGLPKFVRRIVRRYESNAARE